MVQDQEVMQLLKIIFINISTSWTDVGFYHLLSDRISYLLSVMILYLLSDRILDLLADWIFDLLLDWILDLL